MKKELLMIALCMGMVACGNSNAKNESKAEKQVKKDVVDVLYFHGKKRCATCNAIEQGAKEVVECLFSEQVQAGKVRYRVVDITQEESLAARYQVVWSSLLVIDVDVEGEEQVENMTKFAFGSAQKSPELFKSTLAKQINDRLNN